MKLNKILKPLLVSCIIPLSFQAHADDKMNFVTVRAGLDQPTIYDNHAANVQSLALGWTGSIEIGRKINDMFAIGLEYQYHSKSNFNMNQSQSTDTNATTSTWAVKSNVFLATSTVTLVQDAKILPYIKLGLGASTNKPSDYVVSSSQAVNLGSSTYPGKNQTNFAWQLGAGMSVPMHDSFDVDISYAFLDRGKVSTQAYYNTPDNNATASANIPGTARTVKLRDHIVALGVKFKF